MTATALVRSDLDSRRFGLEIFRAHLDSIDERALFNQMLEGNVDVAIIRAPAGSTSNLNRLARFGLSPIHADTLVYYHLALAEYSTKPLRNPDLLMSEATDADAVELDQLVATTFDGYVSHYHANPYLPRDDILAGYAQWAKGYITGDADGRITWVARRSGVIVAFACCSADDRSSTCEGVLYGVHPDHAGGGVYGDLIRFTQAQFRSRGYQTMKVSTQIWNLAVQKVWAREGFVLHQAYDTVHINPMLSAGHALVDQELTLTGDQVAEFARVTGDTNPVHLDDVAARDAGFDSRISHGMLAGGELSRIFGTGIPGLGTLFLRSTLVFMRPLYPEQPHRLQIRYLSQLPLQGYIFAVATIHNAAGELCLLCYSDLLKKA